MPLEREINLTGRALEVIAQFGFTVHVMTKSDLVLRDLTRCARSTSGTQRSVSPSPPPMTGWAKSWSRAHRSSLPASSAMQILAEQRDSHRRHADADPALYRGHRGEHRRHRRDGPRHGASYIIPSFGMTMRDRQRAYYYDKLDNLFPGLREKYEKTYGDRYHCPVPNARRIGKGIL